MDECQQKYQKVYNFLKRTLPQERYEGIRVIDPCVIVADGFNKSFMFAVLGDNMLYLTENPPKLPRDIRITVDLSTVTNIELIHDIPEFIGGDLKTQTQHIIVTYKTVVPQKTQSKTTKNQDQLPSAQQALQTPLLTASALLRLNLDDEQTGMTQPSTSQHHYYNADRLILEEGNHMNKLSRKSNKMSASEGNIPELIEQERFQASFSLCVSSSGRPLPIPPTNQQENRLDSSLMIKQQPRKSRRKDNSESKELNSSSSSNELDFSQVRTYYSEDRTGRPSFLDLPQTSETVKTSWQTSRARSVDETHLTREEESLDVAGDSFEDSLHIYILEQGSPMLAFLKSAWKNCILKSTLHFGGQGTPAACSSPRAFSKVDNSQLLTLFNQLKTEIFQSHRMEKTFVLINELLTAAQKSFSLKKFFWKSSELFQFIVVQLQIYLPHSPSSPSRRKGNNRSDEFDFAVVLLECLVCMFRETEILPSRLNVLKANKGQSLIDLLESVLATPTCPKSEPPKISPAAQLLLMGATQHSTCNRREDDTSELINEITDCVTALLYEIVAAVHQAIIFPVEGNSLNICWLMSLMDSNSSTETFVERMMERQMEIISTRRKQFCPKHAVLLYQQLYVLQNILDYSENLAASIPRSYAEEFRYYIKKPIIQKRLSNRYPLTPAILKILDKVTSCVLKVKTRTSYR